VRVTDEALIRRLRAGDRGAWEQIDRRYRPEMERFARRMLGDVAPDQVEDVVQESFWRAYRALHRDERTIELRPWLYRLTRNCCLDERARRRTDSVELEDAGLTADGRDEPAVAVERRAALRTLLDDLAGLPDMQRHALLRREIDGLSHEQLAGELGVSSQASRSLVHRARITLARAIEARTIKCSEIHRDLFDAHDRRVRPTARALRHLAGCADCRSLRATLRTQRHALSVMVPPAALAAALLTFGVGGKLSLAKVTAITMTAAVAAGVSVQTFRAGGPSPLEVHSNALPGGFLRAGAKIPPGVAIVRRAVEFPGTRDVALGCPAGMRLADLLPPRGGRVSAAYAPGTAAGSDRAGRIRLTGTGAASVTVTSLCRRPDARGSIASASRVGAGVTLVKYGTDLRRTPGSRSLRGSVHRGQPVAVRDRAHGWVHVLTDTGETGWVPAADLSS
jgi:RNA polymerase sigma factor (sigma-70 family)